MRKCTDFAGLVTEVQSSPNRAKRFICICACGWSGRRFFPVADDALAALDTHLEELGIDQLRVSRRTERQK